MRLIHKILINTILLVSLQFNAQNNFSFSELESFKKDFKNHVIKKMNKHDVMGLSVAVEIENQLILEEGFGFSDKSENIKATKDTKYPIGSVSKIITSTAILKLHSDGLIDIDKPYTNYVEDFSMKSHFKQEKGFTIRHLLAHYAGLPRLRAKEFLKKSPQPLDGILANSKEEYLIAPPGKVYQYSDWGADLLSLLVQRVSGMNYEDYVINHIFKPLGMSNSNFGPANLINGYNDGTEAYTYEYSYSGSDGVISTPFDLLKMVHLYINAGKSSLGVQFLNSEIAKDALKKQYVDAPLAYDTEIGLMWEVRELKAGVKRVKFAGIHEPFFTYIFFIPEYKVSIAISSNSNSSSKILWDSWGKLFSFIGRKHGFSDYQGPEKEKTNFKKVKLTDEQFTKIEGSYSTSIGLLDFKRNGNKFNVNLKAENKQGVGVPYSNGLIKLYVKMVGIKIHAMDVFWDEVNGEMVIGEQFKSELRKVFGSKLSNITVPNNWKDAIGTYSVSNYSTIEYKTFDTIKLFINSSGNMEINGSTNYPTKMNFQLGLSPISNKLAVIPGYNFEFFGGETVKLEKINEVYYLTLSGYKFKRIE